MQTSSRWRVAGPLAVCATLALSIPSVATAQSGKWVTTIAQVSSAGGSVDVTVEPRGDKYSRVKLSFRNGRRDMRIAWDIVAGQCRDQGNPIAPQATFTQAQTMMDGSGTATSNVPKLESGKLYYIRVFDPQVAPTDSNVWGCANLAEKEK